MFVIHLANSVRIGDTVDCRINQEPARVTWRDAQTLVIEPGDVRRIAMMMVGDELNCFVCANASGNTDFEIVTDRPQDWRKP